MTRHAHHEQLIAELAGAARADEVAALIMVGSAARGSARPDSDVDIYRVVDDAAFDAALARGEVSWIEPREDAWPGGYVDVKLISRGLMERAEAEADDPFRASLVGASVVHDRTGVMPEVIARIVDPPGTRFDGLARSFGDQFGLFAGYFLPHAQARDDTLARRYAASRAALAAARVVLASDRVLFRGMKYQREQVLSAASGGAVVVEALERLVDGAGVDDARRVAGLLSAIGLTVTVDDPMLGRFIVENELSWFTGALPPDAR